MEVSKRLKMKFDENLVCLLQAKFIYILFHYFQFCGQNSPVRIVNIDSGPYIF